MKTLPIRLTPGQDLRTALETAVQSHNYRAAFVLVCTASIVCSHICFKCS